MSFVKSSSSRSQVEYSDQSVSLHVESKDDEKWSDGKKPRTQQYVEGSSALGEFGLIARNFLYSQEERA